MPHLALSVALIAGSSSALVLQGWSGRAAVVTSSPRSSSIRLQAGGNNNNENPLASLGSQLGSALKKEFDKQLENLQKEAAIAAMQDPIIDMSNPITAPARSLPDSFEDAIGLAAEACNEALADGCTQLVIEFDTSAGDETYNMLSRSLKFTQPFIAPFSEVVAPASDGVVDEAPPTEAEAAEAAEAEAPPPRVQLLFPDEGTAAYVKQNWAELPAGTACGSMPRAKLVQGVEALVLVAPAATEVPAVQRLLAAVANEAPATVVLLINPKLVDMQSTGYGLVGRELRNQVDNSFTVGFALKTYPIGASYRVYPDGWSVWGEDAQAEGGYTLKYSATRRPSGDEIDDLLYADEEGGEGGEGGGGGGNPLAGLDKFIKGFQAM